MVNDSISIENAVDNIRNFPDFNRSVYAILGLPFDCLDNAAAVEHLNTSITNNQRCFLSTPNLNFVVAALSDPSFRNSVNISDLSVIDGMPLLWVARILSLPFPERIAGSSLFELLNVSFIREKPIKIFFFGGPDGVAEKAHHKINNTAGNYISTGFHSPGFGTVDEMSKLDVIRKINGATPDFVVVALGAKKGQAWITKNLATLNSSVISHLGAVINFIAGSVSRAPAVWQRLGLEWLWRIKEEPSLWRRYFYDGAVFLKLVISRVIPAMALAFMRPNNDVFSKSFVKSVCTDSVLHVEFNGAFGIDCNIDRVRAVLDEAVRSNSSSIVIDLKNTYWIDNSVLALFMLLHGFCSKNNINLVFNGHKFIVRLFFKLNCADYILNSLSC